ncbi:Chaperone protein dnaJ 49 [Linum grandiflorum]
MECNKEEAARAMELAEKKVEAGDYAGARKMALKAKKLYPDVDNVSQLLVVCDVHSCAANKINGVDLDWYAILQIERFSNEAVIKKQYKKLALQLHPDKNKCPGAEAAFKLIGEANRELTDPITRSLFDAKVTGMAWPAAPKVTANETSVFAANRQPNAFPQNVGGHPQQKAQTQQTGPQSSSQPNQQTFWTCCPFCKIKFEYLSQYLGQPGPSFAAPQSFCRNYAFAGVELKPSGGNSTGVPGMSKMGEMKTAGVPNGNHSAGGTVRLTIPKSTARKRSGGDNGGSAAPPLKRSREKDVKGTLSRKKRKTGGTNSKTEESGTSENGNESELAGEQIHCPTVEFSDFGKGRSVSSFNVDQIWAIYDESDGMPRFYARINEVLSSGFKLLVTWLEPCPDPKWVDRKFPISCGAHKMGENAELDRLVFSHPIHCNPGKEKDQAYLIYPMKGETWALFKDWSSEPDKLRPPYSYEYVEILSDFMEEVGIGVTSLDRVQGFVSIFHKPTHDGAISFCVKPSELCRFSHRIPSEKMTGNERDGVPAGSFEFDTAALPASLYSTFINAQPRSVYRSEEPEPAVSVKKSRAEWSEKYSGRSIVCGLAAEMPAGTRSMHRARTRSSSVRSSDVAAASSSQPNGAGGGQNTSFQAKVKFNSREMSGDVDGSTSRRSRGRGNSNADVNPISMEDDAEKPEAPDSSAKGKVLLEVAKYDFSKKRTEDRFEIGQIWAIRSNEDRMPKNYALVKNIEYAPFRLHVAVLELSAFVSGSMHTRSYGAFTEGGKTEVLPMDRFSHEVEQSKVAGTNRFEIYPRKDEIWAVQGNGDEECEIVQVVERNGEKVEVMALTALKKFSGFESFYRLASKRQKASAVDISRFSHQCPAYYHHDVLAGCWELDASSVPSQVILLE